MEQVKELLEMGAGLRKMDDYQADGATIPMQTLPPNYSVHIPDVSRAEQWLDRPLRKKGKFEFGTAESFIRYFNEHKQEESRIFANIHQNGATVTGYLNFHGAYPAWRDHLATFALRTTPEWESFTGHSGKEMSQADFVAFLEENGEMFTDPGGAALLELIQTLEGSSSCFFESAIRLQNQTVKFRISEEVTLKGGTGTREGEVSLPSLLKLSIAPFEGVAHYELTARLKYRISNRKLTLWFVGVNIHLIVRKVCADVLQNITKQTGIEPFIT